MMAIRPHQWYTHLLATDGERWPLHPDNDWDIPIDGTSPNFSPRPFPPYGYPQHTVSFPPDHNTRRKYLEQQFLEGAELSDEDRTFWCYTRWPMSVKDLDELQLYKPWYDQAVAAGFEKKFRQAFYVKWCLCVRAMSSNCVEVCNNDPIAAALADKQAYMYRLKHGLFRTAERGPMYPPALLLPPSLADASPDNDDEWARLALFSEPRRAYQMRLRVPEDLRQYGVFHPNANTQAYSTSLGCPKFKHGSRLWIAGRSMQILRRSMSGCGSSATSKKSK